MYARDIMTRQVITIGPGATAREVARRLADHDIAGMPVVDEHARVVGIVSRADLITREGATVAELMTRRVVAVSDDAAVDDVARILTANGFRSVPVLRDGRLVGVVSRADIVRLMASRWVCTVCGHVELGSLPRECPSCGVQGSRFARDLHVRHEITSRQ